MILTGLVAAVGATAMGVQAYQNRRPETSLVATLSTLPAAHSNEIHRSVRQRRKHRILVLGGLATGGCLLIVASARGVNPLALANHLASFLRTSRYGPLLYIAADTIRPLTLFPDSLMTLGSGLLFGPVVGVVVSIVGTNTSAMVAYGVGRKLRQSLRSSNVNSDVRSLENRVVQGGTFSKQARVQRLMNEYGQRMQQRPFESTLIMRGLFLPFDLVSYVAGILELRWQPFLFGTALGALPGMSAGVLAGASLHGRTIHGLPRFNLATLAASGVMLVGSLGVASALRRRERKQPDPY